MNMLLKDLTVESKIRWSIGTPTKCGNYLVLCNTSKGQRINHDVWFDDGRGWQSKWHNMVAWCCLDDIELI